jgi:hypothetical protein
VAGPLDRWCARSTSGNSGMSSAVYLAWKLCRGTPPSAPLPLSRNPAVGPFGGCIARGRAILHATVPLEKRTVMRSLFIRPTFSDLSGTQLPDGLRGVLSRFGADDSRADLRVCRMALRPTNSDENHNEGRAILPAAAFSRLWPPKRRLRPGLAASSRFSTVRGPPRTRHSYATLAHAPKFG